MTEPEISLIVRHIGGCWQVHCGEAAEPICPPFALEEVARIRERIEMAAQSSQHKNAIRGPETDLSEYLETEGSKLFRCLIADSVKEKFRELTSAALGANEGANGYRVRLVFHERKRDHNRPDEEWHDMAAYPWELMFDPEVRCHLSWHNGITFVRSDQQRLKERPSPITKPLKVLIVAASPKGGRYQKLDWQKEVEMIKEVLNLPGEVEIETISGKNTYEQLSQELTPQHCPHVLHFIGHGGVQASTGEGMLVMEDRNGEPHEVLASVLSGSIGVRAPRLRIVVLNCCRGTAGIGNRMISAVAGGIFGLGVPAVVAMQSKILDETAANFARFFYVGLALGQPVDEAVASARRSLRAETTPPTPEWASPVLLLGTKSGDVLGLNVSVETLLERAKGYLEEGKWLAAETMASLARKRGSGGDYKRASALEHLASHLAAADERAGRMQQMFNAGDPELTIDAVSSWAAAMAGVEVAELERLMGHDHLVCQHLRKAASLAKSLGCSDWKGAQLHTNEWEKLPKAEADTKREDRSVVGEVRLLRPDFSKLRKFVEGNKKSQDLWKQTEASWKAGQWRDAHDLLGKAIREAPKEIPSAERERWQARHAALDVLLASQAVFEPCASTNLQELDDARKKVEALLDEDCPSNKNVALRAMNLAMDIQSTGTMETDDALEHAAASLDRATALWPPLWQETQTTLPWVRGIETLLKRAREIVMGRQARVAYAGGCFEQAQAWFTELNDSDRAKLCAGWVAATNAFSAYEWAEARKLLDDLAKKAKGFTDLKHPDHMRWLGWCGRGPSMVAALARMSGVSLVPEVKVGGPEGASPYASLGALGATPSMSLRETSDLSLKALDKPPEGLTNVEFASLSRRLSLVDQRLLTDFAVYTLAYPACVAETEKELRTVKPGNPPGLRFDQLAERIGEDMCIFWALQGRHDGAIQMLLETARKRPGDMRCLHHLGLAAAALIEVATRSTDVPDHQKLLGAWERLIQGWGAIFADEKGFWHSWWIRRRECLGEAVTSDQVQAARQQLQRHWLARLEADEECGPDLGAVFIAEIHGARAAAALGGIPLPDGGTAVLGQSAVREFGLGPAVAQWVAGFSAEKLAAGGLETRVCRYFSLLAVPAALLDEGRFAEAVTVIKSLPRTGWTDEKINPAFARVVGGLDCFARQCDSLLAECLRKQAEDAVSTEPPRVDEAIACWKESVELAARGSSRDAAELRREICDLCVGRAHFLTKQDRSDKDATLKALDTAVILMEAAYEQDWDDSNGTVLHGLVERLLDKAVFLSNERGEHDEARNLARRAYRLMPDQQRSIEVWAFATMHRAGELTILRDEVSVAALLREVDEHILPIGERCFPGNPAWAKGRRLLAEHRQAPKDGLTNLLEKLRQEARPADSAADLRRSRYVEAMVHESQFRFAEAVAIYWELAQVQPEDRDIREKMSFCYRQWLKKTKDGGQASSREMRDLLEEARDRCPNSHLLEGLNY